MGTETDMEITINEEEYTVEEIYRGGYLPLAVMQSGEEFYLVESSKAAGQASAMYWHDMAKYDPDEFTVIVGTETLLAWALGHPAGPGTMKVQSLAEWLELCAQCPAEQWAPYDGEEREVKRVTKELCDALGFVPVVAYRCN